ncbi:MAG: hypothetical protein IJU75_06360 [Clostridia bacterium]|nr:hypothetical protein [Clostridia bacterium]
MKKLFSMILSVCMLLSVIPFTVSAAYELTDYTPPADGVHFTFDNTYASTDPNLTGTPKGAVSFVTDRFGNEAGAVYFQAGDQHIELLKNSYIGDWTVSAWIKTGAASGVDTQTPAYTSRLLIGPDVAINTISNNSSSQPKNSGIWVNGARNLSWDHAGVSGFDNEWYMLTIAYKANSGSSDHEWAVYINGEKINHQSATALFPSKVIPLPLALIGNDSASLYNTQMDQRTVIDDLWIYGKTLTADEVAELYTPSTSTDPVEDDPNDYAPSADGVHFTFNNTFESTDENLAGSAVGSVSFVEDRNGNAKSAVYFDAEDEYVNLGKSDYRGDWSVSAWVKVTTDPDIDITFGSEAGTAYQSYILAGNNTWLKSISNNSSADPKTAGIQTGNANLGFDFAGTAAGRDEWSMITVTQTNGIVTVYKDGVRKNQLDSKTIWGGNVFDLPLLGIGGCEAIPVNQKTAIDDLWIYGKVLSDAEVAALYEQADNGYESSAPAIKVSFSDGSSDGKIDHIYINAAVSADVEGDVGIVFSDSAETCKFYKDGGNPLFARVCQKYDALLQSGCYGDAVITAENLGGEEGDSVIAVYWQDLPSDVETLYACSFVKDAEGNVTYGETVAASLTEGSSALPLAA